MRGSVKRGWLDSYMDSMPAPKRRGWLPDASKPYVEQIRLGIVTVTFTLSRERGLDVEFSPLVGVSDLGTIERQAYRNARDRLIKFARCRPGRMLWNW